QRLHAAGALQDLERGGVGGELERALGQVVGEVRRRAPALDLDEEIVSGLRCRAALARAHEQLSVLRSQLIRSRLYRHAWISFCRATRLSSRTYLRKDPRTWRYSRERSPPRSPSTTTTSWCWTSTALCRACRAAPSRRRSPTRRSRRRSASRWARCRCAL